MTDQMKWVLIGILGFVAAGVVTSLVLLAANAQNPSADGVDGSSSLEAQDEAATTTTSIPTTSTTSADDRPSDAAPSTTTTTPSMETSTTRLPTLTEIEETFKPRHERFFSDIDLKALAEFPDVQDPDFETKVKFRTTLLAAGYVFAALEPGSEERQIYRDSLASADPEVASRIEAAAQHLDPRWASGVVANCFQNDPGMYLITSGVIEPGVDVVESNTGFDSYHEVVDNCIWFTVYHNYNDTIRPLTIDY